MGGNVTEDSKPNLGTTFKIYLKKNWTFRYIFCAFHKFFTQNILRYL